MPFRSAVSLYKERKTGRSFSLPSLTVTPLFWLRRMLYLVLFFIFINMSSKLGERSMKVVLEGSIGEKECLILWFTVPQFIIISMDIISTSSFSSNHGRSKRSSITSFGNTSLKLSERLSRKSPLLSSSGDSKGPYGE